MLRFLLTICVFANSIPSSAQEVFDPFVPASLAESSAQFLNDMGNWDNYLKFIADVAGRSQADSIRDFLKDKVDLNSPFPKFSAEGSFLKWGRGQGILIKKNRTYSYNGAVFSAPDGRVDDFFRQTVARLNPVARFSFLIPSAHATMFDNSEYTMPLLGITVLGFGVAFTGSLWSIVAGGTAMATIGAGMVVLGIAGLVVYAGNEVYQAVRSGEISCNEYGGFVVRVRETGDLVASYKSVPMWMNDLPVNSADKQCTPERALALQKSLSAESLRSLEHNERNRRSRY
jgi:hypothetical protein